MDKSIIFSRLNEASSIALITHVNPDGDTLGAGLALYYFLKNLSKDVDIYCDATLGVDKLDFITGDTVIRADLLAKAYDLAVAVDVGEPARMGKFGVLFKSATHSMVIDHHRSNPCFGETNYVLAEASSTCQITYDILTYIDNELGSSSIDERIASLLYAGLLTDSGAFYYPSTTPDTHRVAGALLGYGLNANHIYTVLFKNVSYPKYLLKNVVMSKTRLHYDGRIAIAVITREDFDATGTDIADTEGIINMLQDIDTVEISILVTQADKGGYKVSFRSIDRLDVNAVANTFGGGGHKNASGCRMAGNIYEILDKLLYSASLALC